MKYLKRFKSLNEDNSEFIVQDFYIPDGESSYDIQMDELVGKIITHIAYDYDSLTLVCTDEEHDEIYYQFYHSQDCCENAWLDDIIGDLNDLLDWPILKAEEKTNSDYIQPNNEEEMLDESWTWTFYTLATINGYVDIRFCGTSNGYYSESIQITKTIPFEKNLLYK